MIRLERLTKTYGAKTAVDALTLEIDEGRVCVLIGPSGCGKTTTLRMINRLVEPTSGRVLIDGRDTALVPVEELRRGLGYAIQSVGLFPHLDVASNIATVPRLLGWERTRVESRTRELLALVGLDPEAYAGKYPRQLSGGEAQRVGVARALAADPPVLLMDEPFGAVDPLTRDRLQAEFARIQRELHKTVIFVTHDVDEAIRLADKIAIMRDGKLEQYDTPENILDHPATTFVRDFMGTDRALKRLGRSRVVDVMRTDVATVRDGDSLDVSQARAECEARTFVYLVDGEGRFEGWLDCRAIAEGRGPASAVTVVDREESTVRPDASLREALSQMLELGFRAIAVTDDAGRIVGEVALPDIEASISETDGASRGARDADE